MDYHLFFIPLGKKGMREVRISSRGLRYLIGGLSSAVVLLVLNSAGFFYYYFQARSLEKERGSVMAYEQERNDLLNKVLLLESTVGETEKLAGKLVSLVGPQRNQLQKGIGPVPELQFDLLNKTTPLPDIRTLNPKLDRLEKRTVSLQDKIRELTKVQEDKLTYIASTPSLWPVKGWVTSDFGHRRSPFTLASDFHDGLDIAAAWGTPIVAPADGVVTFAGYKGGYGKTVIIDHGFGVVTRYGHTSDILVHEGEKIKRGAKIALVGNTGHSTGPHLHYEIHVDGAPVDPMKYILK